MSNNTTVRPFEAGDLVVLDNGSVGDVERYEPLMFPCPKIFVKNGIYTSVWIEVNNIKTIRKPRKGSKEARDIVAMLAVQHREKLNASFKNKRLLKIKDAFKKAKKYAEVHTAFKLYQKAKSMLK